ncbi:trigger factor [Elusimicrobiota bacterium]
MEELNYNVKKEPKCVVNLDIEVPWKEVNTKLEKVYMDLSRELRLPGFRKGKVPLNVIKERYSIEAEKELISRYSPEVVSKILEKENINPVTVPKINDYILKEGQPFKLNVKVEVTPDIQLKKYRKLKVVKNVFGISPDEIEKTISNLREQNASLVVKEKDVISDGDIAVISISVFKEEKEIDAGVSQERLLEIGKDDMLPGFSDKIKGMKKNEEKEFDYKFPENYFKEELKGEEARFKVVVNEIKEKKTPEEKEIVESLGFESIDKLREHIRESLENQMAGSIENDMENQIIEALLEKHEFELPERLVEEEFEKNKKQMATYIEGRGGDSSKVDKDKIMERTEREIRAGIILSQIAKKEEIEVKEEDMKEEEERLLKIFNTDDREKVKKYIDNNVILTRKVFSFLKENARVKVNKQKAK